MAEKETSVRKCLILILNLTFIGVGATTISAQEAADKAKAQVTTQQKQDPVSSEDLEKMTLEIGRLNKAIQTADKKSADRLKTERENSRKQLEQLKKTFEDQQAKRFAELESARAKEATERAEEARIVAATSRKYFYGVVIGLAILASLVITGFVVVRRKAGAVEVPLHQTQEVKKNEILQDPSADQLKEYAIQNGNLVKVPFTITIDGKEKPVLCFAQVVPGAELLVVNVEGVDLPDPIAWNTRKSKIARRLGVSKLKAV